VKSQLRAGAPKLSERKLLLVLGAVQLVNVLDFMMVMPLGPDFAKELHIAPSMLGLVGGAYTAAAAVAGLAGSFLLDRFDRKKSLTWALCGLAVGTAIGGLAQGLHSLMLARMVAGCFAGPASALSLAIIADVVPPERRGRAMGAVLGAFSIASVLGVPAGLELARVGGWQVPFFFVAALGALVATCASVMLPPLPVQAQPRAQRTSFFALVCRPPALFMLLCTAVTMMGSFALIPNLASYFQFNRGYPREHLGFLYLVGGAVTFVTTLLSGRLTDRAGPFRMALVGTILFVSVLLVGFVNPQASLPVLPMFVGFMASGTLRSVPLQSLATRVPLPHERAGFMSVSSSVQHLSAAAGALLSSKILSEGEHGMLVGLDRVALLSAGLSATLPMFVWLVEARLRGREQHVSAPVSYDVASNGLP
jgi:predicted MFS family arabinose efflux permease